METADTALNSLTEGDNVCLICLQLYGENKCPNPSHPMLLYFQNVFDRASKYLSSDIFGDCFQWNFVKEGMSPVCSNCFVSLEKIFKIDQHLIKLQHAIENIINAFTSEVLGHHNKLQLLYTKKDMPDESGPTLKLSSNQNQVVDLDSKEDLKEKDCRRPQDDKKDDDKDFGIGNEKLNSLCEEPEEVKNDVFETAAESGIDKPNVPRKNLRKAPEEREPDIGDAIVSGSTKTNTVTLKTLKVVLKRLQFDETGKVINPMQTICSPPRNKLEKLVKSAESLIVRRESKTTNGIINKSQFCKTKTDKKMKPNSEGENVYGDSDSEDKQKLNERKAKKNKERIKPTRHYEILRRFKCQDESCKLAFNFHKEFKTHISESGHAYAERKKCSTCSRWFSNLEDLKIHELFHPPNKNVQCKSCPKSFKDKRLLRIHNYRSHSPKVFQCKNCEESFRKKTNLRQHLKLHTKKNFHCKACSAKFLWRISLREHKRFVHNKNKKHKCNICFKKLSTRIDFTRHCVTHLASKITKRFPCVGCKKTHYVERIMNKCTTKHSRTKQKGFSCEICAVCFSTSKELDNHSTMEKHINEKRFLCLVCKRRYYKNSDLQHHETKVHKKEHNFYPLKCDNCPRKYKSEKLLREHMKSHKYSKKHECKTCGLTFKYDHNLRDHMNTHTGSKPHECKVCKKSFPTRQDVYKHSKYCKPRN